MLTSTKACMIIYKWLNYKYVEKSESLTFFLSRWGTYLNQDPSSHVFYEEPASSICIIHKQTSRQKHGQTDKPSINTSLVEVTRRFK